MKLSSYLRPKFPRRSLLKPAAVVGLLILAGANQSHVSATAGSAAAAAQTVPSHVPGELLVKFKDGLKSPESRKSALRLGFSVIQDFEHIGWTHIRLPLREAAVDALGRYRQDPCISAVELNVIHTNVCAATPEPNDPGYASEGMLGTWPLAKIHAPEAWNVTTGSSNVVIAVIDTGINYNHEDLAANMWRNPNEIAGNGVDDDQNGCVDDIFGVNMVQRNGDPVDRGENSFYHGSACSGIIGAVGNNGKGFAGVAWNVRLLGVRFIAENNTFSRSDELASLNYLIALAKRGIGLRAVNMSYGDGPYSSAIEDGIKALGAAGVLAVCAAGNDSANNDSQLFYPASYNCPNIVSVAASDQSDNLASFSNYGKSTVDLAAPGERIETIQGDNNTGYGFNGWGTSFAAPHVAGAVALLASAFPDATALEIKDWILSSVDVLPAFTNKTVTGGRLNIGRAMERACSAQAAQAPVVVVPPLSQTVDEGGSIILSVTAGGTPPLGYYWKLNGQDLPGESSAFLVIPEADATRAGNFSVTVSNAWGTTTEQANLAVRTAQGVFGAPVLAGPPRIMRAVLDRPAMLSADANGSEPLSFTWFKNGVLIPGETGGVLALQNVKESDEADYQVIVSNRFGVAESRSVRLSVLTAPFFVWGAYALGPYAVPTNAVEALEFCAGVDHGLFVTPEGTVQSWGIGPGACIPIGLSNVVAVSANLEASYALTKDGNLRSWGMSVAQAGETNVPNSKGPFFAVAAGPTHVLALTAGGTVLGWGDNSSGQSTAPAGLSNVVAISPFRKYSVALRSDGAVISWGATPGTQPVDLTNIVAIETAPFFALALREDGTVAVWGDPSVPATRVPWGLSNVVAIAACVDDALALKEDGSLVAWGADVSGLNRGPSGMDHIVEIGAGQTSFIARQGPGKLVPPAPLDGPGLVWLTDESSPWIAQSLITLDGVDALKSPALEAGQQAGVRTKVLGPGALRYWFKLSADAPQTFASFKVDGVAKQHFTPGQDWQQFWFDVPPGRHILEWVCANGGQESGQATAWLDQVSYLPAQSLAPFILAGPTNSGALIGGGTIFSVRALGQPPLGFQWRTNGFDIPGATGSSYAFGSAGLEQSGLLFSVVITNAYGSVTSAPAMLTVGRLPTLAANIVPASVAPGQAVTLSFVAANGMPGPFTFEWFEGTNTIFSETRDDLTGFCSLDAPLQQGVYYYRVAITSPVGTARFPSVPLTVAIDSDNDGMPNFWEAEMGLDVYSAGDRDVDTDGDGLSNWQEYMAGTCPTNSADHLRLNVDAIAESSCTVQFTSAPGKTYTVLWTDSLAPDGSWRKVADVPASTTGKVVRVADSTAPGAGPARYYRLVTPRIP